MKLEFSRQIIEKYPDIKFRENPFSGSRVVPRKRAAARMEGRTQTDKHDKSVAFSNFANAQNTKAYSFTLRTSTYNHLKPRGYYMYHQV